MTQNPDTEALIALPLTKTHGELGEFVLSSWPGLERKYPVCTRHGAMLRVSPDCRWYRCMTCNIGCEVISPNDSSGTDG